MAQFCNSCGSQLTPSASGQQHVPPTPPPAPNDAHAAPLRPIGQAPTPSQQRSRSYSKGRPR
eukprot:13197713-Alexandrium_andersonii.AAC.1